MKLAPKYKKLFLACIFSFVCIAFMLTSCTAGKRLSSLSILEHPVSSSEKKHITATDKKPVLKIMTLNIAHGRSNGANQMLQGTESIRANLDAIVSLLQREKPDLLGLQEADGPSFWSGNFNHVAYIAERAGYKYSIQGAHVDGLNLSYGTALLSRYPLTKPLSITFEPSPPTFSKGFVTACVNISDRPVAQIVSVHLDFSRKSVRKEQAGDMVRVLSDKKEPLIIMGDFNCEWKDGSALKILADALDLSVYQPDAGDKMISFPLSEKRLDWILISNEFEFVTYRVIPDIVSDHLGVISEIRKK